MSFFPSSYLFVCIMNKVFNTWSSNFLPSKPFLVSSIMSFIITMVILNFWFDISWLFMTISMPTKVQMLTLIHGLFWRIFCWCCIWLVDGLFKINSHFQNLRICILDLFHNWNLFFFFLIYKWFTQHTNNDWQTQSPDSLIF